MGNGKANIWQQTLKNFDNLPDSANVPIQVVCALLGCSAATVWRRVKQGVLAQPLKLGQRTTRWNVGQLRKELNPKSAGARH